MKYTEEWINDKCDKEDYLIAAFSGLVAGVMDIFFVGAPGQSPLGDFTDAQADQLVMKFAKMSGWKPKEGKENSIASAIGFLERKFPVNYDHANTTAVGGAFRMGTKNHHYKSLAHSPDIVGLFFSILDQFQGKASFLSDGKLIRIDSDSQDLTLYGSNLPAKLFCGFCNWLGHIMSDMVGSSGGRGQMTGRRSGVPIPFMNLFQLCDFGELQVGKHRQTLATAMTQVFQEGYDARFGAAMAIPVLINELMIRTLWVIKKRFFEKRSWRDCIPTDQHADLRMMLLVGYGALCLMDGADAAIRSGGNALAFILRLNLVAWTRLVILIFKELRIRYGDKVIPALISFMEKMGEIMTPNERRLIHEYYVRMEIFDKKLAQLLNEYIEMVNEEYMLVHAALEASFNEDQSLDTRSKNSALLAERCQVEDQKIIRTTEDLDDFFLK